MKKQGILKSICAAIIAVMALTVAFGIVSVTVAGLVVVVPVLILAAALFGEIRIETDGTKDPHT
jgi:Flp pilus assembly protein TadB